MNRSTNRRFRFYAVILFLFFLVLLVPLARTSGILNSWSTLASTPTSVGLGAGLAYPGTGDTVYALAGNSSTAFYGYSIARDTWITLASTPATIGNGGTLMHPGVGDTIYAFQGGGNTIFYVYSISRNAWSAVLAVPSAINGGAAMVCPRSGDTIYVMRGGTSTTYYGYSIPRNAWSTLSPVPATVNSGGALVFPKDGDTIYALRGNFGNGFYGYSLGRDTWVSLAPVPATVFAGGALAHPGAGDTIYAFIGGGNANFYAYSMARDTWSTLSAAPAAISSGGALAPDFATRHIYALRGAATSFYVFHSDTFGVGGADTAAPVASVQTSATGSAEVNVPRAATESFVQVNLSGGGTTAGTLKTAATTGTNANYTCTFTMLGASDSAAVTVWTTQSPMRLFLGLRSDTGTLAATGLPSGIANTDTGRRAFGATAMLAEFADSSGRMLGDTKTTSAIGDSFSYSIRYLLSETTVAAYRALGFDTASTSTAFRFWYADTYGAKWIMDTTVTITVSAAAAPWNLQIVVAGITKDLPGGLGGVDASASAAVASSGACVLAQSPLPGSWLAAFRDLRDLAMDNLLGRMLVMLYYFIAG